MTQPQGPPPGSSPGPPPGPPPGQEAGQPPAPYQYWPPPYPPQYPPQYPPPSPQQYPASYPPPYPAPNQQWPGYPPPYAAPAPRPSFPHPEPREYHEMLRTWTYAWWRPTVGILLLAAGMMVVLPIVLFPVLIVGVLIEGTNGDFARALTDAATFTTPSPAGLLYINLTLGATVLWCWGLIRVLHQMRPRWLSSVRPKLRWRFLAVCVGLGLIAVIVSFGVGLVLPGTDSGSGGGSSTVSTGRAVALGLVILLTTPLQAAGEEYAFRGYLLQAIGALVRNKWVAIVVTAALFATAHLQFAPPLFLDRFLFGLIAAWLVIRTGGLEAGIALHVLNNFLALGLAVLSGDLVEVLSAPEADWWSLIPSLVQTLVFAALVAWAAQRMGLQTKTRPPAPEEPSAALVSA